jgi:protein TonB
MPPGVPMMDVMAGYRDPPSRAERVSTIATVTAIHVALGALALQASGTRPPTPGEPPMHIFDVVPPPPPPPPPVPPPDPEATAPQLAPASPGRRASPSPVVAPVARIELPPRPTIAAAPQPGTGHSPAAGAGAGGTGSGAGGSGSGGGGGSGESGGGIGEDARLLGGGLGRRDYRRLRAFAVPSGRAVLGLLVGPDGRVASCTVRQSSGDGPLDAALCALLQPRMQWAPARDRAGRPLTVGIVYTAVWSRD